LRGRNCEQQRAAWCTVERSFGGQIFGIAVFDHPSEPNHPSGWRVDEQGLINPAVSMTSDWTLATGKARGYRYRLLIYKGPGGAGIAGPAIPGLRGERGRFFARRVATGRVKASHGTEHSNLSNQGCWTREAEPA
jgi:hypothetical protein